MLDVLRGNKINLLLDAGYSFEEAVVYVECENPELCESESTGGVLSNTLNHSVSTGD